MSMSDMGDTLHIGAAIGLIGTGATALMIGGGYVAAGIGGGLAAAGAAAILWMIFAVIYSMPTTPFADYDEPDGDDYADRAERRARLQ